MSAPSSAVSVIVPTFNRASLISETLDAVLAQLEYGDELIVVDDGSDDDTARTLTDFEGRIRIVRQENAGKSAALNNGLSHCTGAFVWVVDDDDIVADDARQRLVEPLLQDPDAGFSYGRHDRFSVDTESGAVQTFPTGYWVECDAASFLVHVLEDMFPHQPGMMVRKSLYDKVGPFSSTYDRWEDYEMLIRLAIAAKPIAVPGILFHQRLHSGTRGSKESPVEASQRNANWIELGKRLGEEVIASLPMELFLVERQITSAQDQRRSLLQRGAIYARHHLWKDALQDFESAISMNLGVLSEADQAILLRATQSKFGADDLLTDVSVQRSLRELARLNAEGRDLCRTVGKSLKWRLRVAVQNAQFASARAIFWTYCRLTMI